MGRTHRIASPSVATCISTLLPSCWPRARPTSPTRPTRRSKRDTRRPDAIPKLGYDNFDRELSDEQRAAYIAEGRKPVVRLRMPDHDLTWNDLVRGETTFKAGTVPDFALTRGNGIPLYTLVNPVDDALMKITHVLRGEDLLSSTPRQLALYEALIRIGVADFTPSFGHLPFVMGQGNKKLSKRDPESNLFIHRDRGFIPEGLLNYLALLGWSIADDHDVFSLDEMVAAFDVSKVNSNPARFDQKKADAINAEHIRLLEPADFAGRLKSFLVEHGHIGADVDEATFTVAADLVQTRIVVLSDAVGSAEIPVRRRGVVCSRSGRGGKELEGRCRSGSGRVSCGARCHLRVVGGQYRGSTQEGPHRGSGAQTA